MTAPTTTASGAYPQAYVHLARGRLGDLLTTDLRIMLVTSGYTRTDADAWASLLAAAESTGAGYTTGGLPVPNRALTAAATGPGQLLTCDPLVADDTGVICRWAVLYRNTGDPATSPLISWVDFGADVNPAGDDLTIVFDTALLTIGPPA